MKLGQLPPHVPSSLKLFSQVRSKIVHGGGADDAEVLCAIDSGLTLLKALHAIPLEKTSSTTPASIYMQI